MTRGAWDILVLMWSHVLDNLLGYEGLCHLILTSFFVNFFFFQMRHMFIVLDVSKAMEDHDLRPDRLSCSKKVTNLSIVLRIMKYNCNHVGMLMFTPAHFFFFFFFCCAGAGKVYSGIF